MGPRVKKARTVKTKDSPPSAVTEQENLGKVDEETTETNGSNEVDNKTAVDHGEEEQPPLKKGRGRQKKTEPAPKATKDAEEDDLNGQSETKEAINEEVAPPVKKARGRKKKVADDEEPEVIPKRKDRSVKKVEIEEQADVPAEEDAPEEPVAEEEPKEKTKREKKAPVKKAGKKKKEDEEAKLPEEEDSVEEIEKKVANEQPSKGKDLDADAKNTDVDGGGDAKATKKGAGRAKSAAKAAEEAPAKKKPTSRGKKAQTSKTEDVPVDNDVELDGKRLRVNVEHCKS